MPFPNVPTSQTRPFASSSSNADGDFGVGVNGFFFQNSLPPHTLTASGTITHSFTNNSDVPLALELDFFIPAPTIRFFGVGDSTLPDDLARDATASAVIDLITTFTNFDGTKQEQITLDYGLQASRGLPGPFLLPFPRRDGVGKVTRFDEPDGSFGFRLPDFSGIIRTVALRRGETVELAWHYTAQAQTGFGETGVFAAIGDPFNIRTGGGHFDIQVGPAAIPEPATLATLGIGLLVLAIYARRGRRPPPPSTGGLPHATHGAGN
jgi:hypothetical protein